MPNFELGQKMQVAPSKKQARSRNPTCKSYKMFVWPPNIAQIHVCIVQYM